MGVRGDMTNVIKSLVSKQKKRYTEDGYNLDLSCILYYLIKKAGDYNMIVSSLFFFICCQCFKLRAANELGVNILLKKGR